MKNIYFRILGGLLFFSFVAGGIYVWRLYEAVSYFQNREGVVAGTYRNGLFHYLEIPNSIQDEDIAMLQRLVSFKVYPLTYLAFNETEFRNTIPVPEIPSLKYLTIVGGCSKLFIDETSLTNLLKGENLVSLQLVETSIPENLLKQSPRYSFQTIWLYDVPITDEEFDRFFSLQKTRCLVLASVPLTRQTLEKLSKEGCYLKEIKFQDLPFTEEDLKTFPLQK